jgi:hypothetical protein
LKHGRKHKRRREESNQGTKHSGSGGLSGQEGRTVRTSHADCPPVANPEKWTIRGEHADCPPGTRGLSAPLLRTVRPAAADCPKPLPTKARNQNGSKAKPIKNTKKMRRTQPARTVHHHLADCPPYTDRPRKSTTPKVNTSNPSPDLPNGRSY